jgi:hypothetical protein
MLILKRISSSYQKKGFKGCKRLLDKKEKKGVYQNYKTIFPRQLLTDYIISASYAHARPFVPLIHLLTIQ